MEKYRGGSIYPSKSRAIYLFLVSLLSNIIVTFCILFAGCCVIFSILYETSPIEGPSMQPTLNATGNTDQAYVRKGASYTYGDIIVLKMDNIWIIKRVIALPGDEISMYAGHDKYVHVFRNGEELEEPYILSKEDMVNCMNSFQQLSSITEQKSNISYDSNNHMIYTVPQGHVFVLGDNRANSLDCSENGAYSMRDVRGKVEYVTPKNESYIAFIYKTFFTFGLAK